MVRLFHFSEDASITLFTPRGPRDDERVVWTIDEEHAPSYWFPRDCPRACCWLGSTPLSEAGASLLGPDAGGRMHAIEASWLDRVRECRLYAYEFDPASFRQEVLEAGYWVAKNNVVPISVTPVSDLLAKHADAGIELRIVNNLWPTIDQIVDSGLEFSIIRKRNAQPRVTV